MREVHGGDLEFYMINYDLWSPEFCREKTQTCCPTKNEATTLTQSFYILVMINYNFIESHSRNILNTIFWSFFVD